MESRGLERIGCEYANQQVVVLERTRERPGKQVYSSRGLEIRRQEQQATLWLCGDWKE